MLEALNTTEDFYLRTWDSNPNFFLFRTGQEENKIFNCANIFFFFSIHQRKKNLSAVIKNGMSIDEWTSLEDSTVINYLQLIQRR